jgi:hypothetical protein
VLIEEALWGRSARTGWPKAKVHRRFSHAEAGARPNAA